MIIDQTHAGLKKLLFQAVPMRRSCITLWFSQLSITTSVPVFLIKKKYCFKEIISVTDS